MSSNAVLMGYEGGDLQLANAACGWLSGDCTDPVCACCGQWPGWPTATQVSVTRAHVRCVYTLCAIKT